MSTRTLSLIMALLLVGAGCSLIDGLDGDDPDQPAPPEPLPEPLPDPPPDPLPDPPSSQELLIAFGQCMEFQDWEDLRLGELAHLTTSTGAVCLSCHKGGFAGTYLSSDSMDMFVNSREIPFVERFAQVTADGILIPSDDFSRKAENANNTMHPQFTLGDLDMNLLVFFDITDTRRLQGECTTSGP